MVLIAGLGNPGEKYIHTKHNLGFLVLDHFLKDSSDIKHTEWSLNNKLKSETSKFEWKPKIGPLKEVVLAKPQTYMNNSGLAVSLAASYYKIPTENIWVVYDELDLPLGSMKIRFGGAAAGHHGVESIINSLGSDKFWRFRMGIGQSRLAKDWQEGREHTVSKKVYSDAEDYVLGPFLREHTGKVRELIVRGSDALQMALEKDMEAAMNRYNSK